MRSLYSKIALLFLIVQALSGCVDKSDSYDTIDDARNNHVFEKGWLPDLLPNSTYDLKLVTAVDVSAGRGKFSFDPKEYRDFSAKLSEYDGGMSKIDNDNKSIRMLLNEGYEARAYSSGATNWLFLCEQREAVCEFFVWQ